VSLGRQQSLRRHCENSGESLVFRRLQKIQWCGADVKWRCMICSGHGQRRRGNFGRWESTVDKSRSVNSRTDQFAEIVAQKMAENWHYRYSLSMCDFLKFSVCESYCSYLLKYARRWHWREAAPIWCRYLFKDHVALVELIEAGSPE